ncbi:MAG: T9SS type A sorting domain-containing protein [Saprospiraceae bacterium]|nr:T9SS type A sorting domain-containing protein [Candidatus Defluviibacterium haderslevense]
MKLLYLVLFPLFLSAQGKRDYIWLLGGNRTPTTDTSYQGFQIDFNIKPKAIYVRDRPLPILRQNNASICDKNGNLLMYTAGCNISDRLHKPMPNGKINEGFVWEFACTRGDYVIHNGSLLLPSSLNDSTYFIIHKFVEFDPDSALPGATATKLLYSTVDMTLNNGYGDVTEKNQVIIVKHLSGGDLTATRHSNNQDWWILVPGRANDLYYSIQFSKNGPLPFQEMKLGIPMQYLDDGGSQSSFSPDGTKYARMTPSTGLFLMDFDRTSGKLSNFRNVTTGSETNDHTVGVAFSPDSRFVYLVYRWDLYQVDTWDQDLKSSLVHIATWDGYVEGGIWAAGFDAAMLGPDCKIYIRTGTSNRVMHVIHNPNAKGKACNFEQHGIQLPARNHASIPNFVNYRLGYEPVCDSSLTMTWSQYLTKNWMELYIYPNPVVKESNMEISDRSRYITSIMINDLQGRIVRTTFSNDKNYKQKLDLTSLNPGIYFVNIKDNHGINWKGKFIKQ